MTFGAKALMYFLVFSGMLVNGSTLLTGQKGALDVYFSLILLICAVIVTAKAAFRFLDSRHVFFVLFALLIVAIQLFKFASPDYGVAGSVLAGVAPTSLVALAIPPIVMAAVYSSLIDSEGAIAASSVGIGLAVLFSAILIGIDVFGGGPRFTQTEGRGAGLFTNPNVTAMVLSGSSLFLLPQLSGRFGRLRLIVIIIAGAATVLTFSRSGYLSFGVIAIVMVLYLAPKKYRTLLIAIGVVAATAIYVFGGYALDNWDLSIDARLRLEGILGRATEADESILGRWEVAEASLRLIGENPLGYGAGTSLGGMFGLPYGPHNMFLAVILDYGIVVGLMYFGGWAYIIICALRSRRSGEVSIVFGLWLSIWLFTSHNMDAAEALAIMGFGIASLTDVRLSRLRAGKARR